MKGATNSARPSRLRRVPAPTRVDKLRRFAWTVVEFTLYRWSPVPLHRWRCLLLRLFGARITGRAYPYPSARIWAPWNLELGTGSCLGPSVNCYAVARIVLDKDALISQGTYLCAATHDHNDPQFPLVAGEIFIGAGAWVAADAFVGPGVSIGDRAVVGARGVVVKDVPPGIIVAGNPVRNVGQRQIAAPASLFRDRGK